MQRRKNSTGDPRQVDSKGRLMLDKRFAGRIVIVKEVDETEVVVTLARVVPERETWLYENIEAKRSVMLGIRQARNREFANHPPDLSGDANLAAELAD